MLYRGSTCFRTIARRRSVVCRRSIPRRRCAIRTSAGGIGRSARVVSAGASAVRPTTSRVVRRRAIRGRGVIGVSRRRLRCTHRSRPWVRIGLALFLSRRGALLWRRLVCRRRGLMAYRRRGSAAVAQCFSGGRRAWYRMGIRRLRSISGLRCIARLRWVSGMGWVPSSCRSARGSVVWWPGNVVRCGGGVRLCGIPVRVSRVDRWSRNVATWHCGLSAPAPTAGQSVGGRLGIGPANGTGIRWLLVRGAELRIKVSAWRGGARYHRPVVCATRGYASIAGILATQNCTAIRRHVCGANNLASSQFRTRDCHSYTGNILSGGQCGLGSRRYRPHNIAVGIVPVVDVVVVVVVGDVRNIGDASVGNVDVTNVVLADEASSGPAIPRVEGLAPSQGEPAAAPSEAEGYVDPPACSTNPSHQGRCPEGSPANANDGTGGPSPASAPGNPASVMERSEAP